MNPGIAKRRAFLTARKNAGQRLTIGFTGIADFRSFIGQEYIAGMMKAAADYDINFINMAGAIKYSLFDDIDFIPHYLKNFRFMKPPLLDGLVTWASTLCQYMDDSAVISTFTALKPLPMVDIGYLDIPGVPSIRIDNSSSIRQLVDHLVKIHGYRRLAFIGTLASQPHQRRLEAYQEELARHGIEPLPNSIFMARTLEPMDIATVVEQLCSAYNLHDKQQLDAIVTSSDIIAANVIEELDKRGISVPRDVAITGFNNQYAGLSARSPVTTLNLEYFKRGYTAVELLINLIMNPESDIQTQKVHTSLVLRQSCGCFEQSITEAGIHQPLVNTGVPGSDDSEERVRTYLAARIQAIFPQQSSERLKKLEQAIFTDIYEQPSPAEMVQWFQKLLQEIGRAHV